MLPPGQTGFNPLKLIGLILLAMAIGFCLHAMFQFHRRARLLDMRRSDGFDDNIAPVTLSFALTAWMGSTLFVSLFKKTEQHAAT